MEELGNERERARRRAAQPQLPATEGTVPRDYLRAVFSPLSWWVNSLALLCG